MKNIRYFLLLITITLILAGCMAPIEDEQEDYNLMPVFRNNFHILCILGRDYEHPGLSVHGWTDYRTEFNAVRVVDALGLSLIRIEQGHPILRLTGGGVTAYADGASVIVQRTGSITVDFGGGLSLPDGMFFSRHYDDEIIEYLTEKFSPILGISPFVHEDDELEELLNYHFSNIYFTPRSQSSIGEGNLWMIHRPLPARTALRHKIGYFPIIAPDEAVSRLLGGYGYLRISPWEFSSADDVVFSDDGEVEVRLIYFGDRMGRDYLEVFAPLYKVRYYQEGELYLEYVVSAIHPDYLEENPSWGRVPQPRWHNLGSTD